MNGNGNGGLLDFDWIGNPRLVTNLAIGFGFAGAVGIFTVWVASPSDVPLKTLLAGGLVPAVTALVAKLSRSPKDMIAERKAKEETAKVLTGEIPDRRDAGAGL